MKYIIFIADGAFYFDKKTGLDVAKTCRKTRILQRTDRAKRGIFQFRLNNN